jgi:hypothetical protein
MYEKGRPSVRGARLPAWARSHVRTMHDLSVLPCCAAPQVIEELGVEGMLDLDSMAKLASSHENASVLFMGQYWLQSWILGLQLRCL